LLAEVPEELHELLEVACLRGEVLDVLAPLRKFLHHSVHEWPASADELILDESSALCLREGRTLLQRLDK